ncbi:hypothetical protein K432DRAFT_379957 [Lepidopterella palustris CBS 459.81]|uniref:Uncharacterized protein n=1 Tax=Lepidopterella palustris CBS 459.81 TaxID=1314670 RepID=A0A8E2EF76_9PEZI|nr:hypothetical protein K432DRAFT_379957 [Lepidopterella palustris CBS 459.81]
MSAFSRGYSGFIYQNFHVPSSVRIPPVTRPQWLHPTKQARLFSSSVLKQLASPANISKSTRTAQKPNPSSQAVKSRSPNVAAVRFPTSNAAIRAIEKSPTPVLLYKEPRRGMLTLATYAAGSLSLIGGMWVFQNLYLELPKELPWYVAPLYGSISIIMFVLGMYVLASPVGRVRSIETIPARPGKPLRLKIKARIIPIPFIKPKTMIAKLGEATIRQQVRPIVQELAEVNAHKAQSIRLGLDRTFVLFRPFIIVRRFFSRLFFSWFINSRMAFTRFGIIYLDLHDSKWKIDASGQFLDSGSPLDKFIKTY